MIKEAQHICSLFRTLLAAKRAEITPVLAIASSPAIIAMSRSVTCCHPNLSKRRKKVTDCIVKTWCLATTLIENKIQVHGYDQRIN
jgi:hypothetical protein